LIQIIQG
jgi:hypothetical protein